MSKHTPGPWEASEPDESYHDVIRIWAVGQSHEDYVPVAICPTKPSSTQQLLGVPNTSVSNAALIAAAPDMLEALETVAMHIESDNALWDVYPNVISVIAKAEGGK